MLPCGGYLKSIAYCLFLIIIYPSMIPFTYNTVKLYGPRTCPSKRTVVYFAIGHPHYDDDVDDDSVHETSSDRRTIPTKIPPVR